jgi:phenylalanyl-tRNA synthetase beta chain
MKISYEWLREYVNTKMRPEAIADFLTMAGHEVSAMEKKQADIIFDIEVTPNRPDCLSHIGIAREISVVTGKKLRPVLITKLKPCKGGRNFKIIRENKSLCPFYTFRILKNTRTGQSPKWVMKKLVSIGLNPISNIVDITNFVLFETGHPLHAFDMDKIAGDEIAIRNARPDESIVTIDGVERKLDHDMLVIADKAGPIAIAGIMGGQRCSITESTQNVVLESAYFDPVNIRRTSYKLGLSTDSSYRFERGADLGNIIFSSNRAAALICDIAKATPGVFLESKEKPQTQQCITLRTAYLNAILGIKLKPSEIRSILSGLGYKIKGGPVLEVTAPSYRQDTTREADLIEEVARVYGYNNIPTMPATVVPTAQDDDYKDFINKRRDAKEILVASGFYEAISFSLISKGLIKAMLWPGDDFIQIRNPLSKEQEIMRPSLLPGLLKSVEYNLSRQVHDVKLFELSNVYFKDVNEYKEEPYLSMVLYERPGATDKKGTLASGFFQLKGVIAGLAENLNINNIEFQKATLPLFSQDSSVVLLSDNTMLGSMGRVRDRISSAFNITGSLFCAELNFKKLALSSSNKKYYRPLPRFPYSYRDISFAIKTSIEYAQITALIKRVGGTIVESIELLSEYRGQQIGEGKRGLAVRIIFRSKDKTLPEEEISAVDTAIRKGIEQTFHAVLR